MKLYHFLAVAVCLLFMSSSTMKMPVCASGEHELFNNTSCDLKYYAAVVDISDPCGSHYTISGTVTAGNSVCIAPASGEMVIKIAVIDSNNDQLWVGDTQCAGMQDDDTGTLCGLSGATMTWDSATQSTVDP